VPPKTHGRSSVLNARTEGIKQRTRSAAVNFDDLLNGDLAFRGLDVDSQSLKFEDVSPLADLNEVARLLDDWVSKEGRSGWVSDYWAIFRPQFFD
jgi:hypothetical protein